MVDFSRTRKYAENTLAISPPAAEAVIFVIVREGVILSTGTYVGTKPENGRKKGYRIITITPLIHWCRRGDLNPHRDYSPLDPESSASTNSATSAC